MSTKTDIQQYETSHLNPANDQSLAYLVELKQRENPGHLDWLSIRENGTVDFIRTVHRLAQWWSQLSLPEKRQFCYGPDVFKVANLQATFFKYEMDVDFDIIQKALNLQVQVGLLKRVGRSYAAVSPDC